MTLLLSVLDLPTGHQRWRVRAIPINIVKIFTSLRAVGKMGS